MSRCQDSAISTSATTSLTKHSRFCCSSWQEFVRTPPDTNTVGETVRKGSTLKWMGESTNLGQPARASTTRTLSFRLRGRHQDDRGNLDLTWKRLMKQVDHEKPTQQVGERLFEIPSRRACILSDDRTMMLATNLSGNRSDRGKLNVWMTLLWKTTLLMLRRKKGWEPRTTHVLLHCTGLSTWTCQRSFVCFEYGKPRMVP